jgi:hypothetical protein
LFVGLGEWKLKQLLSKASNVDNIVSILPAMLNMEHAVSILVTLQRWLPNEDAVQVWSHCCMYTFKSMPPAAQGVYVYTDRDSETTTHCTQGFASPLDVEEFRTDARPLKFASEFQTSSTAHCGRKRIC